MSIRRRALLLVAVWLCLAAAMGLTPNPDPGGDNETAAERRRGGFCILPIGFLADSITGDCNWSTRNSINWTIKPTIQDGVFIAAGEMKPGDETPLSWSASNAMSSSGYYSPFQIYADCNSSAVGAILPPLGGRQYWGDLDPADVVADKWTVSGRSFSIRAWAPSSWAELENLELLVYPGTGASYGVLLSSEKIRQE